jgi:hypothetical protein
MARKVLAVLAVVTFIAVSAHAQERVGGAGRFEIGAFPGGGMFFTKTSNGNEPEFGNYALGGSFTFNVNRWIGIEGEGGGTVGLDQSFNFNDTEYTNQQSPNTWMYHGNVVVNPIGNDRALVPYVTGGLGGVTLSPRGEAEMLGVNDYETFLASNVGGGVKWFATTHVGFRGDYRLFVVKDNEAAPLFFGNETRYGHRVQGGMTFTF